MQSEVWLPIPGYEGMYEVSSIGRVRSLSRLDTIGRRRHEKFLSPRRARSGHLAVALFRDGGRRNVLVHHLVLAAFVGPRPAGLDGCHANDIPDDNRVENLRWDTRSANQMDSVRNGTHFSASKTHCPQGHAYTPENTYLYPQRRRACRECRRLQKKRAENQAIREAS